MPSIDDDDTNVIPRLCLASPPIDVLNGAAWMIVASLFYFELQGIPVYELWGYYCEGRVRCRLGIGVEREVMKGLAEREARFLRCGDQLNIGEGAIISFTVVDLRVEVSIVLYAHPQGLQPISGSPFTVHKLVKRHHLYCPFGTANHLKRMSQPSTLAPPAKGARAVGPIDEPDPTGRVETIDHNF
ncbi:hypothetical protein HOY80DRAFT_1028744 [Tuber brumale]|nr:hypothetical protein HOY80DRAFT_1028744 [Tuber brumale]